jgi:hypothetical protein
MRKSASVFAIVALAMAIGRSTSKIFRAWQRHDAAFFGAGHVKNNLNDADRFVRSQRHRADADFGSIFLAEGGLRLQNGERVGYGSPSALTI